jgi:hypothetical protein
MWVRNNRHLAVPGWAAEPPWGRVVATTVRLWVRRAGRWQLAAVCLAPAVIALAVLQLAGVLTPAAAPAARAPSPDGTSAPAAATQAQAAAWVAGQVSSAAMIGCYPGMCAALQAQGVAAGRLVPLRPGSADPLGANVVVTSAPDGSRLAPALIASFGSGRSRIEVRAVEPGGAAAYAAALRADLAARRSAGSQLLRNWHIRFTAEGAAQLRAGQVDSRLLATLAALAAHFRFRVAGFGDAAPGAQVPFRQVTIGGADLAAALALVRAQDPPYLPAHAVLVPPGLSIEFAAPSPLGLLTPVLEAEHGSAAHTR